MDGLALLCTLHADGPSTLKRLRRAGLAGLDELLEQPAPELAELLDVSPPAARRMLREARLLSQRVGPELDVEEAGADAPPGLLVGGVGGGDELPMDLPVPGGSELDRCDRSLLERIASSSEVTPSVSTEAAGPELPTKSSPVGGPVSAPVDEDVATQPEELRSVELQPLPSLEQAVNQDRLDGEIRGQEGIPAGAIEGLDSELSADLARIGVLSLGDLANIDSLGLRRQLGVTFAQAKRLGFLARRAQASSPQDPGAASLAAEPVIPRPVAQPEPRPWAAQVLPEAQPAPPPPDESSIEPSLDSPQPCDEVPPRPKFWEPRRYMESAAKRVAEASTEAQGERVDPSVVTQPRRFWEARSNAWAANVEAQPTVEPTIQPLADVPPSRTGSVVETPAAEPGPAVGSHVGQPAGPAVGDVRGTTLGWDWSVERPGDEDSGQALRPQPGGTTWRPLRGDEDASAGPFA